MRGGRWRLRGEDRVADLIKMKLPRLFLLVLLSTLAGCTPAKPREVRLTPREAAHLKEQFSALDRALRDKAVFIEPRLAASALEEDLALLRTAFGGSKIEPLEAWFLWHNGSLKGGAPLLPLGWAVSISEALRERHAIRWIPLIDGRRKKGIKILDDGAGDGFYVDLAPREPRVFYHMLQERDSYTDFGRIDEFVEFIAKVHAAGIASESKPGVVVFDDSRYTGLEKAYLSAKSSP